MAGPDIPARRKQLCGAATNDLIPSSLQDLPAEAVALLRAISSVTAHRVLRPLSCPSAIHSLLSPLPNIAVAARHEGSRPLITTTPFPAAISKSTVYHPCGPNTPVYFASAPHCLTAWSGQQKRLSTTPLKARHESWHPDKNIPHRSSGVCCGRP